MWDALARYRALILVGALLIAPPILLWGQTRAPNARGPVVGLIIEVASWIERPLLALSGLISDGLTVYVGSVTSGAELIQLRRNSNTLIAAQNRIRELEHENDALRKLAEAAQRIDGPRPLGARIIGRTGAPLTRLARIDRGTVDGVQRGDAVVNPAGVVGQILSVGRHTSDVLLMTDPLSALDVVVQRTRARGIIRGSGFDDSYQARVEDFDRLEDVQPGDKLVTSALTEYFPPGVLVGEIREVFSRADSVYRRAEVTPAVEMASLEHVLVLIRRPAERLPRLGDGTGEPAAAPSLSSSDRGAPLAAGGQSLRPPVAQWAILEHNADSDEQGRAQKTTRVAPMPSSNAAGDSVRPGSADGAAPAVPAPRLPDERVTALPAERAPVAAAATGQVPTASAATADSIPNDGKNAASAERTLSKSDDVDTADAAGSDAFPPYYEDEIPLPGATAGASGQEPANATKADATLPPDVTAQGPPQAKAPPSEGANDPSDAVPPSDPAAPAPPPTKENAASEPDAPAATPSPSAEENHAVENVGPPAGESPTEEPPAAQRESEVPPAPGPDEVPASDGSTPKEKKSGAETPKSNGNGAPPDEGSANQEQPLSPKPTESSAPESPPEADTHRWQPPDIETQLLGPRLARGLDRTAGPGAAS